VANERLQPTAVSPVRQKADDGIPEPPAEWARELRGLVGATRQLEHGLRARLPNRLVLAKRGREVVAGREAVGEHDCVLDRLARARGRRVRGVAAAVAPARQPPSSAAAATAAIGSCQPEKRRSTSAFLPSGSSASPSGAFFVANQYVRPRPMSASPKRSPTPHDSVRRPGCTGTGEIPRQAVYPA
jgi:hypothetical protein